MSQRAFLAEMDAGLHASFAAAGMADLAAYTSPDGGAAVPCQVYVDRDSEMIGGLRQFVAGRVEVAYVRTAGFRPASKGRVLVDGELYLNSKLISDDGSLSRWLVIRVTE